MKHYAIFKSVKAGLPVFVPVLFTDEDKFSVSACGGYYDA